MKNFQSLSFVSQSWDLNQIFGILSKILFLEKIFSEEIIELKNLSPSEFKQRGEIEI